MQSVTATWVSGGLTQVVTTVQRPEEELTEWAARHRDAVDALLALFPIDPR